MGSLMIRQNSSMTVGDRCRGQGKMKGLQCVDSTMASASSNYYPAAILHTTRSTIKDNLTVKIGELTNRHKAHKEAWHMGNRRNSERIDRKSVV